METRAPTGKSEVGAPAWEPRPGNDCSCPPVSVVHLQALRTSFWSQRPSRSMCQTQTFTTSPFPADVDNTCRDAQWKIRRRTWTGRRHLEGRNDCLRETVWTKGKVIMGTVVLCRPDLTGRVAAMISGSQGRDKGILVPRAPLGSK
jgi:hypothetical protein